MQLWYIKNINFVYNTCADVLPGAIWTYESLGEEKLLEIFRVSSLDWNLA